MCGTVPPVTRTSSFPAWDRVLDGKLAAMLADWRAEEVPFAEIAHRLRVDHSIRVSAETVRRWCIATEAVEPDEASA